MCWKNLVIKIVNGVHKHRHAHTHTCIHTHAHVWYTNTVGVVDLADIEFESECMLMNM